MKVVSIITVLASCWIPSEAARLEENSKREVSRNLRKKSVKALDFHSLTIEEIKASKKGSSGKGGKKNWKGDGYGDEPPNPLGKGKSSKSDKSSKCDGKSKGKGKGSDCGTTTPTATVVPTFMPSISPKPTPSPTTSSAPSGFPTIEFDLQVCQSYSRRWLRDLSETCEEGSFKNCRCMNAEEKIITGAIDCGSDRCPAGCAVCNFCLESVIDCVKPGNPTKAPTVAPVAGFNLQICETYADSWITDIETDGYCKSAQRLISSGTINCEVDQCPSDCPVCNICLESLFCEPTPAASPSSSPTMTFDLQKCVTYSDNWITDMVTDGYCKSAQQLISSGIINCEVDQCPSDCPVCNICFETLFCEPAPAARPSSVPSKVPTRPPSNPVDYFNLNQCNTYEDEWITDVITHGYCKDAQERIATGQINCETAICPENCSICHQCLMTLNCQNENSMSASPSGVPSIAPSSAFDLSDCDRYAYSWFIEFMTTNYCSSAQALISNGSINCSEDVCPDGCDMCSICMDQLQCHPAPSTSPTIPFSISQCNSYSNDWLFDIADSCNQSPTIDYSQTSGCSCNSAQQKILDGSINCGLTICPDDCEVCKFCLYYILDCVPFG